MSAVIARRGSGIAVAIEGFFAAAWFSWGTSDNPPSWLTVPARVLAAIAVVVGIAGVVLALRSPADRATGRSGMRGRGYRTITIIEVVAIIVGIVVLSATGHREYLAAWTAFVVGVHFFPLAQVFGRPSLRVLGTVVCLVAIIAVAVGVGTDVSATVVAGVGVALVLLVSAVSLLRLSW